jgi:hypothetical protein
MTMKKTLIEQRDELASSFTQEASGELFELEKKTGVGWGSDEAVCHIIEGSFQAGWDARDKAGDELLEMAITQIEGIILALVQHGKNISPGFLIAENLEVDDEYRDVY